MKTTIASILCLMTVLVSTLLIRGQQSTPPAPKLEFAFELHAEVGKPDEVGAVPGGTRHSRAAFAVDGPLDFRLRG